MDIARPEADKELEYASHSGATGKFRARLFNSNGRWIALLTDIEHGEAKPSITNNIERAAARTCDRFDLDPVHTDFIEHYDNRGEGFPREHMFRTQGESFDRVMFSVMPSGRNGSFARPSWKRIQKSDVETMIGGNLP